MRNIFDLHTKVTLITDGGSGIDLGIGRQFTTLGAKVIIPGHTPQMSCDAPLYAGMFYTMVYIKAIIGS